MYAHEARGACEACYGGGPPSRTCISEFWQHEKAENEKFHAASTVCAKNLDLSGKDYWVWRRCMEHWIAERKKDTPAAAFGLPPEK